MNNSPPDTDLIRRIICSPHVCFKNQELKNCSIVLNFQELPMVWSGQFAVVFKLQSSIRTIAVRCFTSEIQDQELRYRYLAEYLTRNNSAYFVPFQYLREGILVQGKWWPVVKMDWVNGKTLDLYIEQIIRTRDFGRLHTLLKKWQKLNNSLVTSNIAHGDLSHNNVLIENEEIKLVDYDASYVPNLKNRKRNEFGTPHYQHPLQQNNKFDETIDNFSSILIFISIFALYIEPTLWDLFHSDDYLIFSENDLQNPSKSNLFSIIKNSKDSTLAIYIRIFEDICLHDDGIIPSLDEFINLNNKVNKNTISKHIDPTSWISDQKLFEAINSRNKADENTIFRHIDPSGWIRDQKEIELINLKNKADNNNLFKLIDFFNWISDQRKDELVELKNDVQSYLSELIIKTFGGLPIIRLKPNVNSSSPSKYTVCKKCRKINDSQRLFCSKCYSNLHGSGRCPYCGYDKVPQKASGVLADYCPHCRKKI